MESVTRVAPFACAIIASTLIIACRIYGKRQSRVASTVRAASPGDARPAGSIGVPAGATAPTWTRSAEMMRPHRKLYPQCWNVLFTEPQYTGNRAVRGRQLKLVPRRLVADVRVVAEPGLVETHIRIDEAGMAARDFIRLAPERAWFGASTPPGSSPLNDGDSSDEWRTLTDGIDMPLHSPGGSVWDTLTRAELTTKLAALKSPAAPESQTEVAWVVAHTPLRTLTMPWLPEVGARDPADYGAHLRAWLSEFAIRNPPVSVPHVKELAEWSGFFCYLSVTARMLHHVQDDIREFGPTMPAKAMMERMEARQMVRVRGWVVRNEHGWHVERDPNATHYVYDTLCALGLGLDDTFAAAADNLTVTQIAGTAIICIVAVTGCLRAAQAVLAGFSFAAALAAVGRFLESMLVPEKPRVHPVRPGYCYLALFERRRWRALARVLGRYPRARAVLSAKPDYCIAEVEGSALVAHITRVRRWRRSDRRSSRRAQPRVIVDAQLAWLAHRGTRIGASEPGGARPPGSFEPFGGEQERSYATRPLDDVTVATATAPIPIAVGEGYADISAKKHPACVCRTCGTTSTHWSDEDAEAEAAIPCFMCDGPRRADRAAVGRLQCRGCSQLYDVGESGPSVGTASEFCSCGLSLASGDHEVSPHAKVLWGGADWTSTHSPLKIFGKPGALLTAHAREMNFGVTEVRPGCVGIDNTSMYCALEPKHRSVSSLRLHWLSEEVLNSSLAVATPCPENERRASLWAAAVRYTQDTLRGAQAGDFWAVTAGNEWADMLAHPPCHTIPGATGGIYYTSRLSNYNVDSAWRVIEIPLEHGEGRLLAGLRLVPLVAGRTDVTFGVCNSADTKRHPVGVLDEARRAGFGIVSVARAMTTVNLGALFAVGCIYRADRKEIASSFARFGDAYGWDESVLAVRAPHVIIEDVYHDGWSAVAFGRHLPGATVFARDGCRWVGRYTPRFDFETAVLIAEGKPLPLGGRGPYPCVNRGWAALSWGEMFIRAMCTKEGIPFFGNHTTPKLARTGTRVSRVTVLTDNGQWGEDPAGVCWRSYEFAAGLRDRLAHETTQNLSPDLWEHALSTTVERPEQVRFRAYLHEAAQRIGAWASDRDATGVIGVASVPDLETALAFKRERGSLFQGWVFFSESPRPEGLEEDFWAHLPRMYGSGNTFQLARLLPGIYSGPRVRFSVINDLETDWYPRDTRLRVGLEALRYCRAACPAMDVNSPCPFQDICYYGDAFADKASSLLDAIARWGWIYGMDEVWLGAHKVPTVPITLSLGGAGSTGKSNPEPAVMLAKLEGSPAFTRWEVPGGCFRGILRPRDDPAQGAIIDPVPGEKATLPWSFRFKRAFGLCRPELPLFRVYEPEEWTAYGAAAWASVTGGATPATCLVTWGTWGDRVPILAGARAIWRATGTHVFVRHLTTLDEGKAMLALCENDSAHRFLPELAAATAEVARMPGHVVAADYLSWSGKLSYSLRPHEGDAATPGGGMPPWADWLVSLVFWKDRARVRVGLHEGMKWFPRSADGETMLGRVPTRQPGGGKKGVCIGSSSIPVPAEFADWEPIPAGDHFAIAQAYDEIVCDGGAGKVETFKAAGVPIVRSTNSKIDRKWHDPNNCGIHVTHNQPANKWALVAAWEYPTLARFYCGWSVTRWVTFAIWRVNAPALLARVWTIVFVAWCFRYKQILPTLESTALHAVGLVPAAGYMRALWLFIAVRAMRALADARGKSMIGLFLEGARVFLRGLFSPVTTTLIGAGMPAIRATLVGGVIAGASLAPLADARVATYLGRTDPTIWLALTPVWAGPIPIGLHAALYQPSTQTLWEGAPVTGRTEGLGSPFRLRVRQIPHMQPLLAVRTSLHRRQMPETSGPARPYSAIHNCQTLVLGIMLRHGKELVGAEVVLLLLGTAYAGAALTIGAAAAFVAATVSWVMLFAVIPIDSAFPDLHIGPTLKRVKDALSTNFMWFAGEPDVHIGYTECMTCEARANWGEHDQAKRAANEPCASCGNTIVYRTTAPSAPCTTYKCAACGLEQCRGEGADPPTSCPCGSANAPAVLHSETQVPSTVLRDTAALLAADAIRAGVDESVVFNAIADAVPFADIESDRTPGGVMDALAPLLFEERRGPSDLGRSSFSAWASRQARAISRAFHLPGWVLEAFAAVVGAVLAQGEALTIELVVIVAEFVDWLAAHNVICDTQGFLDYVNDKLNALTPDVDRRKNVWAVLSKKRIERLRRGELLALSLREMRCDTPTADAIPWMTRLLNKHHPDGATLEEDYLYRFPSWLPHRPRVSEQEYQYPSLLHEVEAAVDPELTERVANYLALGGQVGLDGMWAATDDMRERVTSRYFSEPPRMTADDEELAHELANFLFETHRDAFDAPALVRPETVKTRLNKKGRPGLPFIQKVRTRRALESTGWMKAIISATYECLETGEYPPDAYTEFAKMMVLPATTVTTKGPRTIMATSLVTNFVNGVYELERRTRKVWPTTDTGLGAPLTAGYLGEVFEKVAARKRVFVADATAYDANVPPVLFEVLSILGELGAANSIPAIGQALRQKYVRLQNAVIVDLPTGKQWVKSRGGATGQSATSWDNTWTMRALIVGSWARATGLPINEFYLHNTVHNTGDDNVWGTDSEVSPQALSAAARDLFGVDVRIEFEGVDALSYLSKKAVRVADHPELRSEILRVLPVVPEWTAMHDQARLLSRRGAVVSRFAGAPYQAYKQHLAERSVGHALLSVHNRPLYNMLAHEWMEDVRKYIAARPYAVVYDVTRDANGDLEAVGARFTKNYVPTALQAKRMQAATKGGLKFPSYQRVLEANYTSKPEPELSQYAKVRVMPTFESVIREHVVRARVAYHSWLPDALVKLSPSPAAAPHSAIVTVHGFPVEKYVWRTMAPTVTLSEFASELRQAPYSSSTDATGFWWYLELPGVREDLLNAPMPLIRGRMVVTTAVYMFLTELVHIARGSKLGLLVEAFQVYTQDAPRLFALLDSLHWLDTGRSSAAISTLTPKDPYATQKHVAVWAATFVWDGFAVCLGALASFGVMARVAEMIAHMRNLRVARDLDLGLKTPHANRWYPYTPLITSTLAWDGKCMSLSAPTSTGKSTELPAALLLNVTNEVWLVVHTRYLRDTYQNPWVSYEETQKLSAGINKFPARLYVCTYGHFCARLASAEGPAEDAIVIFDEFHARMPIQGIASHRCAGVCRIIFATATPDALYEPEGTPHVSIPLEREWGEITPTRLNLPPMELYKEAKRAGEDTSRVLFILPTIRAVDEVTLALLSMGEQATAVTAKRRTMPPQGHVVATPVAEAGVNITPPATGLIDSGLTHSQSRGVLTTRPTTAHEHVQRLGRVGRRGAGWAYTNTVGGSGETPLPYPSYLDVIAGGHARAWLLARLEIDDDLEWLPGHSLVDSHMRLAIPDTCRDVRTALQAWWLMSVASGSPSYANRMYDQVALTGWPEELDAVSNLLGSLRYLAPRSHIQPWLDAIPFEISRGGRLYRVRTLVVRNGQITH